MRRLTLVAILVSCFTWMCSCGTSTPLVAAAASPTVSPTPLGTSNSTRLPKHVFLIVLENESYANTFGANAAADSYLKRLSSGALDQGDDRAVLLENYYGVGHNSLDNYIAMISGQPPNLATQIDCPRFKDIPHDSDRSAEELRRITERLSKLSPYLPFSQLELAANQLRIGCVYPQNIVTLANQIDEESKKENKPLSWRAYMEDMPRHCAHPEIDEKDSTKESLHDKLLHRSDTNKYATRHNPFVYFHSLIDATGEAKSSCEQNDVPLVNSDGSTGGLIEDLNNLKPFPSFVFISPNLCNDGHNECVGKDGQKVLALTEINDFLREWVPIIRASQPFKDDGMLIITFDEAQVWNGDRNKSEENRMASEPCCGEKAGKFSLAPGLYGPGGGQIGAIILSPLYDLERSRTRTQPNSTTTPC